MIMKKIIMGVIFGPNEGQISPKSNKSDTFNHISEHFENLLKFDLKKSRIY